MLQVWTQVVGVKQAVDPSHAACSRKGRMNGVLTGLVRKGRMNGVLTGLVANLQGLRPKLKSCYVKNIQLCGLICSVYCSDF